MKSKEIKDMSNEELEKLLIEVKELRKGIKKINKYHKEQINAIQKKIGKDVSEL